jgi:hypothetical protein
MVCALALRRERGGGLTDTHGVAFVSKSYKHTMNMDILRSNIDLQQCTSH